MKPAFLVTLLTLVIAGTVAWSQAPVPGRVASTQGGEAAATFAVGTGQAAARSRVTPGEVPAGRQVLEARGSLASADLRSDPRVRAFVQAYAPLLDSVAYGAEDVVFYLGRRPIHFQDGRMLAEGRLEGREQCTPIFYRYSLEPLTEPPAPEEDSVHCTDVMESLWGTTEAQIRRHGQSVTFLDHSMFVNTRLIEPLADVERDLLAAARRDASVADWMDELDITYSFINRDIAGSPTRSHHAWGTAIDLVPDSYEGRHVYWRWSRVFNREGWQRIPMSRRWSPPQVVVETFERHGFVWGGKWPHFDMIHFEYRPEILLYNQLVASTEQGG